MSDCTHPNITSAMKFCGDCGKSVNSVAREPGELLAFRNQVMGVLKEHPPKNEGEMLIRLLAATAIMATLDWALGKTPTETLTKLLAPVSREAE